MRHTLIPPSSSYTFYLFKAGMNERLISVGDGDGWVDLSIEVDGVWEIVHKLPAKYATTITLPNIPIRITTNGAVNARFSTYVGERLVKGL